MKKFLALLAGAAMTGTMVLSGVPAVASSGLQASGASLGVFTAASEPTSFVLFGEQPTSKSGTVAQTDLKKTVAAQNQAILQTASPARAAWNYDVYSSWKDNKGKTTAIRWGTATWGWRHVQKHNVSLKMIQKTTKFPQYRFTEPGNRLIYRTPANKYTCWIGICRIEKSMMVYVLINNKRLDDGKHRGVITTYCEGPMVCPSWVREVA